MEKERMNKAEMIVTVKFPVHEEEVNGETKIIPPMEYSFKFPWEFYNHMSGSEEDRKYILKRMSEYREFDIENKMKQIIFYYQRATGAKITDYEIDKDVVFS